MKLQPFKFLSKKNYFFCTLKKYAPIWLSLRYAEKSGDLVSFVKPPASRLVVRFSKCQKRFLLKKLNIVDTYITVQLSKTKKLQTFKVVSHASL